MRGLCAPILALAASLSCRRSNPAYLVSDETDQDAAAAADVAAPPRDAEVVDATGIADTKIPRPPADTAPAPDAAAAVRVTCPSDLNLMSCFRFEGRLRDESPYQLTAIAAAAAFEAAVDGRALRSAAGNDIHVTYPPLPTANFAVEAWVLPSSVPTGAERAGIVDSTGIFSLFIYGEGVVRCSGATAIHVFSPAGLVKVGVWSSLACVGTDTEVSLWHNGVLIGSTPRSMEIATGATEFLIGANQMGSTSTGPDPFDGLIDNVRIWRVPRSAADICAVALGCP